MAKFQPTQRQRANLRKMPLKDAKAEYTKQARVANKRIDSIKKAGLTSYAITNLEKKGIERFGLKNQNLQTDKEIRNAYKELMKFLESQTSTKTGIKDNADAIARNFGLEIENGDYVQFQKKFGKIFDLYDELMEMDRQGIAPTESNKYELVSEMSDLYDAGIITEDTNVNDIIDYLQKRIEKARQIAIQRQKQLRFHWDV